MGLSWARDLPRSPRFCDHLKRLETVPSASYLTPRKDPPCHGSQLFLGPRKFDDFHHQSRSSLPCRRSHRYRNATDLHPPIQVPVVSSIQFAQPTESTGGESQKRVVMLLEVVDVAQTFLHSLWGGAILMIMGVIVSTMFSIALVRWRPLAFVNAWIALMLAMFLAISSGQRVVSSVFAILVSVNAIEILIVFIIRAWLKIAEHRL